MKGLVNSVGIAAVTICLADTRPWPGADCRWDWGGGCVGDGCGSRVGCPDGGFCEVLRPRLGVVPCSR